MPEIEVVKRAVATVNFGVSGDPQRIANVVGDIPYYYNVVGDIHYTDLDPRYFEPDESDPEPWHSRAGLAAWPEGEVEKEVAVLRPNCNFPNYAALKEFVDELRGYGHLLFPWLTVVPPWANELYKAGNWWVVVTDPDSLYRGGGVPYFYCGPDGRGLYVNWVGDSWGGNPGVLVSCKL